VPADPAFTSDLLSRLLGRPFETRFQILSELVQQIRGTGSDIVIDGLDELMAELQPVQRFAALPEIDFARTHYRIDELVTFEGHNFVRHVYRALLKREPEPKGLQNYTSLLDSGQLSGVDVIAAIASSPEARSKKVSVEGVDRASRKLFAIPVIGRILRILAVLVNLDNVERSSRALRRSVEYAKQDLRQEQFNATSVQQVRLKLLSMEISGLCSRLDRLQTAYDLHRFTKNLEHTSVLKMIDDLERRKADVSELASRLSGKVERDDLTELLNEWMLKSELMSSISQKADVAVVVDLDRRKADREAVDDMVAARVADLDSRKANRQELEDAISNLAADLENRKADRAELDTKANSALLDEIERRWQLDNRSHRIESERSIREAIANAHEQLQKLDRYTHGTREQASFLDRRLSMLVEEVRRTRQAPPQPNGSPAAAIELLSDPLYLEFEDLFRGTQQDIKERVSVYLPRIQAAGVGSAEMRVLDVGCGRGEWLELLRENGLDAYGVDVNFAMISTCRAKGLQVEHQDVLTYLRNLPDRTLGAITGFHIVEHLPFSDLVGLIDDVIRVLKPGGLAIFETPNPKNLQVGACNFYTDPTHQKPLPSPLLQFMLEARGLCSVEVLPLHAFPEAFRIQEDSRVAQVLNELVFGEQDYAVIGRKV
jgi:SAM-dependent methyltransferase